MHNSTKIVFGVLLALVNLGTGIFLGFIFWLTSLWMIDEGEAFTMTTAGWLYIAAARLLFGAIVAVVVGLICGVVSRFAFTYLLPNKRMPFILATAPGWMIAIGTSIGCIQFLIEKPHM